MTNENIVFILLFSNYKRKCLFYFCREKGVDLGRAPMIAEIAGGIGIEDVIHVHHKLARHESLHAKKKSAVNQEAVQRVVKDVMGHHHDETEKKSEMKSQKIDVGKKIRVVVDLRNHHASQNVHQRINPANAKKESVQNATMMQKRELEQKIHRKENRPMTHPKRIWILRIHHEARQSNNVHKLKYILLHKTYFFPDGIVF